MLMRVFIANLLLGCLALPLWAADPAPKSLDEQLLDDLDTELLPPTVKKPSPGPASEDAAPRAKKAEDPGLDQKLLDEIDGEDIELGEQTDPLTRIGRTMRQVETLIDKRDTSKRTQEMQKQIVRDLEQLLEVTKQQCQGGQCKPSSSSQKTGNAAAGNKPAEGDPSNKPARDSVDRLGKAGKTDAANEQDMDELVKQVWGHLPEKVRGQMQNVSVENFLPKYEKLIEEYYKRLAEESR